MAAYWGLAPQYAAVLGYVGGAVTGGASFGTALGSLGRPLMTLAHGAGAFASPELVAMTNATVTGVLTLPPQNGHQSLTPLNPWTTRMMIQVVLCTSFGWDLCSCPGV